MEKLLLKKNNFLVAFTLSLLLAVSFQFAFFNRYIWLVTLHDVDYAVWEITFLGIACILVSTMYLFPYKKWMWWFLSLDMVITVVAYADLLHLRYFGIPLFMAEIFQLSNLKGTRNVIKMVMFRNDIMFFLPLGLIFLVLLYGGRKATVFKRNLKLFILLFSLGAACFGGKLFADFFQKRSFFTSDYHRKTRWVFREYTPVGYHFYDGTRFMYSNLVDRIIKYDSKEVTRWFVAKSTRFTDTDCDNRLRGIARGKNIIILQVESLHACVLNKMFQGGEITPQMNRMLEHSIYFPYFYSQIGLGHTADVEFMVNTSIYPAVQESVSHRFDVSAYHSLPRLLKKNGYATFAAHGNSGMYWNRRFFLPALGFDEFKDIHAFFSKELGIWGIHDNSFLRQSGAFLKTKPQPFFAYLITVSGHYPFEISKKHQHFKKENQNIAPIEYDYVNAAHYMDEAIGSLRDALEAENLMQNTLLIIIGDHNPFLYEGANFKISHLPELAMSQSKNRVPFIIYSPDFPGVIEDTYGGHMDIYPTLLHLLGITPSPGDEYLMGRNLFCAKDNFVIVNDEIVSDGKADPSVVGFYSAGYHAIAEKVIKLNYFKKNNRGKSGTEG